MLIATLLSLILAGQPTPEHTAHAQKTQGRYAVIKLTGDLDSEHMVNAFGKELDEAKDANLIILEVDGNRSRTDLVAKLGARIKGSHAPVSVLLKDAVDKRVGV